MTETVRPIAPHRQLGQDTHWVAADGRRLRLEDMGRDHRTNTLRFLRRRADRLMRAGEADAHRAYMSHPDAFVEENGIGNRLHHEMVISRFWSWEPERWLEQQPLVRRLAELVGEPSRLYEARLRARNRLYEATHPGWKKRRERRYNELREDL